MAHVLSNTDISANVFETFGVVVDEECLQSYPLFASLLNDLCNRAKVNQGEGSDFEVEKSRQAYLAEKTKYDEFHILLSAVTQVVDKNKDKFTDQKVSCPCIQNNNLTHLDSVSYISMGLANVSVPKENEPQGMKCLGMTREFFTTHFHSLDQKFLDSMLIPLVSKRVLKFGKSVLAIHGQECAENDVVGELVKLPHSLTEEADNLRKHQKQVKKEWLLFNCQLSHYFECLRNASDLLLKRLDLMKRNRNLQSSKCELFSDRCDALYLKIKTIQLKIMNDTYNEETIVPLRKIRDHVDKKEVQLEQDLFEKSESLKRYKAISETFDSLAEAYAELTAKIETENWTLKVLKNEGKNHAPLV